MIAIYREYIHVVLRCHLTIVGLFMIKTMSHTFIMGIYIPGKTVVTLGRGLGAVSIQRCRFTKIRIPMLKIRRSSDRLIFNMGIAIPGKDGLYVETGPWCLIIYNTVVHLYSLLHIVYTGFTWNKAHPGWGGLNMARCLLRHIWQRLHWTFVLRKSLKFSLHLSAMEMG